jgi:hypothetical protein
MKLGVTKDRGSVTRTKEKEWYNDCTKDLVRYSGAQLAITGKDLVWSSGQKRGQFETNQLRHWKSTPGSHGKKQWGYIG